MSFDSYLSLDYEEYIRCPRVYCNPRDFGVIKKFLISQKIKFNLEDRSSYNLGSCFQVKTEAEELVLKQFVHQVEQSFKIKVPLSFNKSTLVFDKVNRLLYLYEPQKEKGFYNYYEMKIDTLRPRWKGIVGMLGGWEGSLAEYLLQRNEGQLEVLGEVAFSDTFVKDRKQWKALVGVLRKTPTRGVKELGIKLEQF
jgi:hypothetical protein